MTAGLATALPAETPTCPTTVTGPLSGHQFPATRPRRSAAPYLEIAPTSEPPFDDDIAAARGPHSPTPGPLAASPQTASPQTTSTLTASPPGAASHGAALAGAVSGGAASPVVSSHRLTSLAITPPPPPAARVRTVVQPPAGSWSTTGHRTFIGATGVPPWSSESDVGVRRTGTESLPPAARSGQVFARALVEILSGRRPLAQLRVHCAPDIYAGLLNRPLPAAVSLPHLLTVRVCEPADGVAEVSAAFKRAQRVRAIAFRIQGVDGRWRITALEVG